MTLFEKIKLERQYSFLPAHMLEVNTYDGKKRIETRSFEPEQYKDYSDYVVETVKSGYRAVVRYVEHAELVEEFLNYISFTDKIMADCD